MDESIVAQKLESLRRCIQRVESRLPTSLDTLLNDLDTQDINWEIVFIICNKHLKDFTDFAKVFASRL
jgi:hypothetical protein